MKNSRVALRRRKEAWINKLCNRGKNEEANFTLTQKDVACNEKWSLFDASCSYPCLFMFFNQLHNFLRL